jgi:hypothetical protein
MYTIAFDMITVVHQYSDIETRISLQKIFKNLIKFRFRKVKSELEIKFKYVRYIHFFKSLKETVRQWCIHIPFGTKEYVIFSQVHSDKAEH